TGWTSGVAPAVGISPAVHHPQNAIANTRLARDPALRRRVTVLPVPSCRGGEVVGWWGGGEAAATSRDRPAPSPSHHPTTSPSGEAPPEAKVTTADVLEVLHQVSGMNIVADFYTHLYVPRDVSVQNLPLFDALNQLCDAMSLRWSKDGDW